MEKETARMIQVFEEGGYPMWFLLAVALAALTAAGSFAARPTRRRLELTRILALTTLASILMGTAADIAQVGHRATAYVASHPGETLASVALQGLAESMSPSIFGFSCLAIVGVLAALGAHRSEGEMA
jgi:predicted membrane protein